MRPWRRRRPAGPSQVPSPPPPPMFFPAPVEPTLVRLGADRAIIDTPWGLAVRSIANIWPDPHARGGWARVSWPTAAYASQVVAPLDLQIGHVLEVATVYGWRCFGWIADADPHRFVLAPARDATAAHLVAQHAAALWRIAELTTVEGHWRERIDAFND